mgnify:FL=1
MWSTLREKREGWRGGRETSSLPVLSELVAGVFVPMWIPHHDQILGRGSPIALEDWLSFSEEENAACEETPLFRAISADSRFSQFVADHSRKCPSEEEESTKITFMPP